MRFLTTTTNGAFCRPFGRSARRVLLPVAVWLWYMHAHAVVCINTISCFCASYYLSLSVSPQKT